MGARDVLTGAVTAAAVVAAPAAVNLHDVAAKHDIPEVALAAYVRSAQASPCGVRWQDMAGLGAVESNHGRHGGAELQADGKLTKPIESWAGAQGPMQFMTTPDVPTWQSYEALGLTDGDGDGVSDVNDIDDAAWAAANYLCRNGYRPDDDAARIHAIGAYNGGGDWQGKAESEAYVLAAPAYADQLGDLDLIVDSATGSGAGLVIDAGTGQPVDLPALGERAEQAWAAVLHRWDQLCRLVARPDTPTLAALWEQADRLVTGRADSCQPPAATPTSAPRLVGNSSATGTIVAVDGIEVDASAARSLERLLDAAEADGIDLGGYGWRSYDDQVALRQQNCGTSHYLTYEAPAEQCSPPTARPGFSNHNDGLAADFTWNGDFVRVSTPAFDWLSANAPTYGWHNLPSESWHWSTDPAAGH